MPRATSARKAARANGSSSASGEIYFRQGEIVGAVEGARKGMDALHRFLGATEGSFEFIQSTCNYDRTIKAANNTSLLLELLADSKEEPVFS